MTGFSKSLFCFVCLFLGSQASAKIALTTVKFYNASNVIMPDLTQNSSNGGAVVTQGSPVVYGGISGLTNSGECSSTDPTNTCNNCTNQNTQCNVNRILPSTLLTIEFQTDNTSVITNTSALFLTVDSNKITPIEVSNTLAVNSTLYMKVRWSDICAQVNSDTSCSTEGNKTFSFGISTQVDSTLEEFESFQVYIAGSKGNQYFIPCPTEAATTDPYGGYCHIEIERGDQKVYLTNEIHGPNFNRTEGGIEYKYLRVFYAAVDSQACQDGQFASVVNSTSPYKDITFTNQNNQFTLDDPTITGLENGLTYYFRFANVDVAGNVSFFSADQTSPTNPYLNCLQHSAVPAEVVGLLDGKECFIATAAFGSPMAPQLNILREFRDRYLKSNAFGKWLITKYYKYSPQLATKIKKREKAKAAVRIALSPVITAAQWVVTYGLQSFILLSSMAFVLGFFVMRRLMRDED